MPEYEADHVLMTPWLVEVFRRAQRLHEALTGPARVLTDQRLDGLD